MFVDHNDCYDCAYDDLKKIQHSVNRRSSLDTLARAYEFLRNNLQDTKHPIRILDSITKEVIFYHSKGEVTRIG